MSMHVRRTCAMFVYTSAHVRRTPVRRTCTPYMCASVNNALKFCSMTKSGGQPPAPNSGGDLSPVPSVIYAHALNMPLCNEAQSLLDLQVIPIRSLDPNTDSIYGHPIWTRFAMAEVTSAPPRNAVRDQDRCLEDYKTALQYSIIP